MVKPAYPPYNWNIVESDIKHHNPNPYILHTFLTCLFSKFVIYIASKLSIAIP